MTYTHTYKIFKKREKSTYVYTFVNSHLFTLYVSLFHSDLAWKTAGPQGLHYSGLDTLETKSICPHSRKLGPQIPVSFFPTLFFWKLFLSGLWIVSHLHSSNGPAFASGSLRVLGSHFNLTFGLFEKVGRFRHRYPNHSHVRRNALTSPSFRGP